MILLLDDNVYNVITNDLTLPDVDGAKIKLKLEKVLDNGTGLCEKLGKR